MEISHKKMKVVLTMPDVFTGQHYIAYFDVMEAQAEKYSGQKFYIRSYLSALAVAVDAKWDGKDLKTMSLNDIPMRVIKWVADSVTTYITKETEVPEA